MAAAMHPMEEEQSFFSTLFSPALAFQMPEGEVKARRWRKKSKRGGEGDDEEGFSDKKRRLSHEQVRFLEKNFVEERKLESSRKLYLAGELGLDPKQVAVWFQNRRARLKSKKLEEEYVCLRSSLDAAIVEKCRLENEVLKLKEKLAQSEEEIKRLTSTSGGGGAAGSPSSSLTTTGYGELCFPSLMEDFCYLYDFRM